MIITWDGEKAEKNKRKHGICFQETESVFFDPHALSMEDRYATGEERYIVTGRDILGRVITVVYTHRGESIRIISARSATKRERGFYEKRV